MTESELLRLLEEEYFDKILGFCILRMNTREEAEDLAQDIALELIRIVRRGQTIENLGAFLWRVSENLFLKRLRQKKTGGTVYLPEDIVSSDSIEEEITRRETENLLRREIAFLSEHYRKAVVLHYFDGKGIAEIAGILRKSPGTVKWWLHDARNLLKEGIHTMREFGERSFKPENLVLSCQFSPGADGEPMSCARRKSAQNILLAAYRQPITIEELCTELGIAAPYIEDEVQYLTYNQLMRKVGADRYQTDFVILENPSPRMFDQIVEACFPAFSDKLFAFLEDYRSLLTSSEYNPAGFSWERLLWVYIHMVTEFMTSRYKGEECHVITSDKVPERPNGGSWIALGFTDSSEPPERPPYSYEHWDGPVHKPSEYIQSFHHWWSGLDSNVFFDIPEGVFRFCLEFLGTSAQLNVHTLTDDQKYLLSIAIDRKLILTDGDIFLPNYYSCKYDRLVSLAELTNTVYPQFKPHLDAAYKIITDTLVPDVPKHLLPQAANRLSNYLHIFITRSLYDANERGLLSVPTEADRNWLSLYAAEI